MNIGIDFDGVLTDFVAVAVYQMLKARGISHKDCKSFNLWECDFNITKKKYEKWFEQLSSYEWEALPRLCTQEDIDNINKVSRHHSIYGITNTPGGDAIHQRNLWLFNNGVEDVSVIPARDKGGVIFELEIEAMLDDSPKQLEEISKYDCKLYHPIYPYNIRCAGDGVTSITDYLKRIGVI